ncbi:MurR/RpiR family transcriptional regulator [Sphingopyxis lindanitolerans]|uniref:MurR/RpiR family transcriptional regulator n=1 Tax=Sphingopyxis lindanitolerans TaxID=2054227 RepID=A0A2S8B118_9SPHN|nr:MurR/RpiR family transcriptional regulator [Sphingopyxis lindanitolerans]PQM26037.1 MurR/RpiR family transcriptional regulator [Sphingopyxis lindanitolerans]
MADLFTRLEAENATYTAAERQIALFLLSNRELIPFETAASIAARLGVSAVTVGRFCRMLGFRHFRELKEQLRASANLPWLQGTDFQEFLSAFRDSDNRRKTLEREIELTVAVYERSQNKVWQDAVGAIARAARVQVVGFQTERGIASLLAHNLQYVRPGVELIDGASGHFADLLIDDVQGRCLIIVDIRRYSRQSRLLAEKARDAGLPLVILTDTLCDWAPRLTPHVLTADSDGALFWQSSVPMVALINLLVNDIVGQGGGREVEQRLERVGKLYDEFTGFVRSGRQRGNGP